jgi:thymidine kinase
MEFVNMPAEVGWIEVITGCMFSGKSEELVRRIKREMIVGRKVQLFKPAIDTRDGVQVIRSRGGMALRATPLDNILEVRDRLEGGTKVVGLDEAQFFNGDNDSLRQVCEDLADRGCRVIVSGLDQDFRGLPFEPMVRLMGAAEQVSKVFALCMVCGAPAHRSVRISGGDQTIQVGSDEYEARCRLHSREHQARK